MEIKCEPAAFAASSEAFGDAYSTAWQWQRYSRYLPARFFGCAPTQGASQTLWLSPRLNQALVYPIARGLIGKRGGQNPSVPGSSPGGPTNFPPTEYAKFRLLSKGTMPYWPLGLASSSQKSTNSESGLSGKNPGGGGSSEEPVLKKLENSSANSLTVIPTCFSNEPGNPKLHISLGISTHIT